MNILEAVHRINVGISPIGLRRSDIVGRLVEVNQATSTALRVGSLIESEFALIGECATEDEVELAENRLNDRFNIAPHELDELLSLDLVRQRL